MRQLQWWKDNFVGEGLSVIHSLQKQKEEESHQHCNWYKAKQIMDRKNLTKDNHSTSDPCDMAVQLK